MPDFPSNMPWCSGISSFSSPRPCLYCPAVRVVSVTFILLSLLSSILVAHAHLSKSPASSASFAARWRLPTHKLSETPHPSFQPPSFASESSGVPSLWPSPFYGNTKSLSVVSMSPMPRHDDANRATNASVPAVSPDVIESSPAGAEFDPASASQPPMPPGLPPPQQPLSAPTPFVPESQRTTCFPSSAIVRVVRRGQVRMDALKVGDRVVVSNTGLDSQIVVFSHRLVEIVATFVVLETPSASLTLTPSHLVYARLSHHHHSPDQSTLSSPHNHIHSTPTIIHKLHRYTLLPAASLRVGDHLLHIDNLNATVIRVHTRTAPGLFNPHTAHGDIVVDDFVVSSYTRAVKAITAHALLAPIRALFTLVSLSTTTLDRGFPLPSHPLLYSLMSVTVLNS